MSKYEVTVVMVFPDDLHEEDIIDIAKGRLDREVVRVKRVE